MTTLKAEKRDPQVKAKKLRREGFVTGVLYGKEMKENVALKFEEKEALRFTETNGWQVLSKYLYDGKNFGRYKFF